MKIYVNGRFTAHRVTGIQRYAHEVASRLPPQVRICQPGRKLRGWQGHLWEQTVLPIASRSGILWSPCASGPLNGPPQVVTFHDLFPLDCASGYREAFVGWYRVMLAKLARSSARVIAVSNYTKARLVGLFGLPPEKIAVIHSGVDRRFFEAAAADARIAAESLALPAKRYLLYVGSLEPRKNLARLLTAWSLVFSCLPSDLWLVVSGSCDTTVYEGSSLFPLPPRVHLTGYVPDSYLAGLYAGSLGFLFPSLAEGFGFPPLEAMAAGAPVLTSDTTALPEVCGGAALYVDPSSVPQIARGIIRLASDGDLRERLREMGRKQASGYTWDRTATETYQVLESVRGQAAIAKQPVRQFA